MGGHGGGSGKKPEGAVEFVRNLALGGISGVIAKTANAPIERVKILLQTQSGNTNAAGHKPYNGFMDAFKRLPKEQGFLSFWRGNFANCARYFPTQAMNFAFKARYQKLFVKPKEEVGFAKWFAGYLAAGGAAGATALTVSYPLEYSYTRLAADVTASGKPRYNGIADLMRQTIKTDGIRGIYRGYGPSVAGIIVYRAGYFGLYDVSKQYVMPMLGAADEASQHSAFIVVSKFFLALGVDILSAMVAYPLDTVRRRLMMMSNVPADQVLYRGAPACFNYIVKNEGVPAFWKGAGTNCIRAGGSALVLVLYDELKHMLDKE